MKKIALKQVLINVFFLLIVLVLAGGVSFSLNEKSGDKKDLIIESGNMQVVLNTNNLQYEFTDVLSESVSDAIGLKQDGYAFSVTNTGNIPIEYYEIRLVNQENKVSNLPYKYLRFTICKDNETNCPIKNLGDENSILYSGFNLDIQQRVNFNLKMWIDIDAKNIYDKELYGAMEITLYQKYDIYDNYVLYDSNNGSSVTKTAIYSPITEEIPQKDGYVFLGWSETKDGEVIYQKGDTYRNGKGTTLYAKWKKQDS